MKIVKPGARNVCSKRPADTAQTGASHCRSSSGRARHGLMTSAVRPPWPPQNLQAKAHVGLRALAREAVISLRPSPRFKQAQDLPRRPQATLPGDFGLKRPCAHGVRTAQKASKGVCDFLAGRGKPVAPPQPERSLMRIQPAVD